MEWHWLIRSYRFQVYISMTHDLYVALCAHPQSQIFFCRHIFGPVTLFCPLLPFSNHHTVFCLCLRVSVLYPTYEWNHTVLGFFWLTYFTQHNVLKVHWDMEILKMAVFDLFCGWVISHCMYVPHLLYLIICQRTLRLRVHQ